MPPLQPLLPFLRPLAPPRPSTCRHLLRFSTASRLRIEQPIETASITSTLPSAPPTTVSASRTADLAAAEAVTESDSAQPAPPARTLPSKRPSKAPSKASSATPPNASIDPYYFRPISHTKAAKLSASPSSRPTAPPPSPSTLGIPEYRVGRSHSKNYPVYHDWKRGGNLLLTTVTKVTGSASALRDELRRHLNKKEDEVKLNALTGHVVVKGHHKDAVVQFLKSRGV